MEDSSYKTLKNLLSSVPAKALNYSSRLKLANNLNDKLVLPTKNGTARDYRGFAGLIGFQYSDIKKFERHDDPTIKIFESWETQANAMLDKLISYLEEMERHDVIEELLPLLERDVETYVQNKKKLQEIPIQVPKERDIETDLQKQKLQETPICVPQVIPYPVNLHSGKDMQLFTRDDIRSGECTHYDAYVSYADPDIRQIYKLANFLESPEIGLKLFIRDRDMLAGCVELDTNVELIKNRCRRMLIILTSNYHKSSACEYQTSFAASLAIEQCQSLLIPVIIEPCEVPPILKFVSKVDFTKPGSTNWVYEKLINSLIPEHRSPMSFASLWKRIVPPILKSTSSVENIPAITFPPSTKQLCNSVNTSAAEVLSITSSENAVKNSAEVSSKTKKWKLQFHF